LSSLRINNIVSNVIQPVIITINIPIPSQNSSSSISQPNIPTLPNIPTQSSVSSGEQQNNNTPIKNSTIGQTIIVRGQLTSNGEVSTILDGTACTIQLRNSNGTSTVINGFVANGVCEGTFSGPSSPQQLGLYNVSVTVNQQNNLGPLTGNGVIQVVAAGPVVLPRTGGLEIAVVISTIGILASLGGYYFTKRNRLKLKS